jgi:hypothetical protein
VQERLDWLLGSSIRSIKRCASRFSQLLPAGTLRVRHMELAEGAKVSYDAEQGAKGPAAANVQAL